MDDELGLTRRVVEQCGRYSIDMAKLDTLSLVELRRLIRDLQQTAQNEMELRRRYELVTGNSRQPLSGQVGQPIHC